MREIDDFVSPCLSLAAGQFFSRGERNDSRMKASFALLLLVPFGYSWSLTLNFGIICTIIRLGPWIFDERVLTDQNPKEIVLMTVREKLLDYVPEDVPYNVKLSIMDWKVSTVIPECC